MSKWSKPRILSEKELNIIRGKAIVGHATPKEILSVFGHYELLELKLDELDGEDTFGTEGWRHSLLGEDT